jgi:hypothetical protein
MNTENNLQRIDHRRRYSAGSSRRMSSRTQDITRMQTNGTEISSDRSYLEDILPSFQMHNYMFNRTIYDGCEDELSNANDLPSYTSEVNTIRSTVGPNPHSSVDPTTNPKLILLNNADQLPQVDVPIEVKIVLTKRQPKIGKIFERESPLTEYSPGDLITGFVTIKSHTEAPIPFEMMLVSLEGVMRTTGGEVNEISSMKRTFLKMYDLSACYHTGQIFTKSHGVEKMLQKDSIDDTVIGFNSEKAVFPNVVHKKFFSFRLPHTLLDTACSDQIPEHLHILPSYGFDETSMGDTSDSMEIDPALGYKRFEDVYGSPIIVNDLSLKGQSVSYFVKVQMIGRRDVAKLFSRKSTPENSSPFAVFSDVHYSIRVSVDDKQEVTAISNVPSLEKSQICTNIRTYEQLIKFESYVIKAMEELKTRRQLILAGILKKREQDEIIGEVEADESKKAKQLTTTTNYHPEITRSDEDHFFHYATVELTKDVFGRAGGDLVLKASIPRDSTIRSTKVYALKTKEKSVKDKEAVHDGQKTSNMMTSISAKTRDTSISASSSGSSGSFNTVKSPTGVKRIKQEHCFIDLELTFNPISNGKGRLDPPSIMSITSSLKAVNIYSTRSIPMNFDGEFLMDEQLIQYTVPSIKRHFSEYLTGLKHLTKDVPVPQTLYNSVDALSKLMVKEFQVPKFEFLEETINISNRWLYDSKSRKYRAHIKLPLAISSKLMQKSTLCIVPTFESCLLNHYYMVHFHISFKRGRKYAVFKFPIKVV